MLALEDQNPTVANADQLFEHVADSFAHILRLSSTVTQGKGPVSTLLRDYVDSLHKKIEQLAEATLLAQD